MSRADVMAIALDVGGTSVKSGLVSAAGRVVGEPVRTRLDSQGPADAILDTFAAIIEQHRAALGNATLCGVGFGFPDPMTYPDGIAWIKGQFKFDALYGMHVGEAIRARLELGDLPILFRNDAEAAIVGEALYGAGQSYRRLIGVTLGTGLGSSFLVDGVRQVDGPGVPADHDGFLWPLPALGARADDVFSIRGLVARFEAAGQSVDSIKDAAAAARMGDPVSRGVFEQFGNELGQFLKPFAESFGAQAVLTLGGIAGAFDLFGAALQTELGCPVLQSVLGGDAALIGAADLVLPH